MSKNKILLQQKYPLEVFYTDFTLLGLSDAIFWIDEVVGSCKMGI